MTGRNQLSQEGGFSEEINEFKDEQGWSLMENLGQG